MLNDQKYLYCTIRTYVDLLCEKKKGLKIRKR